MMEVLSVEKKGMEEREKERLWSWEERMEKEKKEKMLASARWALKGEKKEEAAPWSGQERHSEMQALWEREREKQKREREREKEKRDDPE